VKVMVDYVRALGQAGAQERAFCTVLHDRQNVAVRLVEEGLAKVVSHRQDEKRASQYDQLLAAEQGARAKGKGMHGKAEPPGTHPPTTTTKQKTKLRAGLTVSVYRFTVVDGLAGARKFLPFLSRSRNSAIVDWVISATRFKLIVPSQVRTLSPPPPPPPPTLLPPPLCCLQNCIITLSLAGLRGPRREDKWGDFALRFTTDKALHRDVFARLSSRVLVSKYPAAYGHGANHIIRWKSK
jgi:hypothetical protein